MATRRLAPLTLGIAVVSGCATLPPEQAQREAVMWEAARECQARFLTIDRIERIDHYGRVWFTYQGAGPENQAFLQCYRERVQQKTGGQGLVSAGRPVGRPGDPGPAVVPVEVADGAVIVSVSLDGRVTARLLLDTGASKTVLRPVVVERLGLTVGWANQRQVAHVVGGRTVTLPLVRIRSLALGPAAVEDLDVAAFDALPHRPDLDGLLGADVLGHFTVTVDRHQRRLVLGQPAAAGPEPASRSDPARAAAPAPAGGPWEAPRWRVGDEWHFRWQSPRGSGTFVWTVEAEARVGDQDYWVVRSGSRRIFYTKTALAWDREEVDGAVVVRARPAFGYAWPLEVGKGWDATYEWEDLPGRRTEHRPRWCEVAREESVEVPAGTFPTRRVVCRDRGGRVTSETWFAPAVGHWVKERSVQAYGDRIRELLEHRRR